MRTARSACICVVLDGCVWPKCAHCERDAVCIGAYEGLCQPELACSECCGHGNEDGWCEPLHREAKP